ncbi:MAG: hypothetical protein EA392_00440 [Cryomorphaceae bacterium]|nr:MAG: hypothetical protein EA392_00440 [Cryomorphaceae bacterium]
MNLAMLPARQKRLADTIIECGFRPTEFDFEPLSNEAFNLKYKAIPAFQMKYQKGGNHKGYFNISPGPNQTMRKDIEIAGFEKTLVSLKQWLDYLRENVEVVNPWDEVESVKDEVFGDRFDSYEELLDDETIKMFDQKLTMLLEYFESQNVDVAEIKEDIAFLKTESKRAPKRSLRNQFMGIVLSWFVTGLVPPEIVPEAMEYIKRLFASFRLIQLP